MALRELVGSATDAAQVKRVFGQPIDKDGVTVIPVAAVRGAFGGGEGAPMPEGSVPAEGPATTGGGGGGAFSAVPVGVYVIRNGELAWHPAVDQNRVVFLSFLTGILGLLILRSIARTIVKRG